MRCAIAIVAVTSLLAAGCVTGPEVTGGADGSTTAPIASSPSASSTASGTTTGPPEPVRLDGFVRVLADGYAVNLSAYNPGPATYGYSQDVCSPGYGPSWTARLSGPPGADLDYRDPTTYVTSCSSMRGQPLAPGGHANWTFDGARADGCERRYRCDNVWDLQLTLDGQRQAAPSGMYTWEFVFAYAPPGSDVNSLRAEWTTTVQVP